MVSFEAMGYEDAIEDSWRQGAHGYAARFDRDGDPLFRSVATQWLEWE